MAPRDACFENSSDGPVVAHKGSRNEKTVSELWEQFGLVGVLANLLNFEVIYQKKYGGSVWLKNFISFQNI